MKHEVKTNDSRFGVVNGANLKVYKIEVVIDGTVFSVFHRYSEFRELYDYLKEVVVF